MKRIKVKKTKEARLEALAKGREKYKAGLADGSIKRLTPLEKAQANPKSLRLAVNAMCCDCNGYENWHNRTKYCQIFTCPLWNVRKGSKLVTKEECLAWTESTTPKSKKDQNEEIDETI
jgi:hypothetical protein